MTAGRQPNSAIPPAPAQQGVGTLRIGTVFGFPILIHWSWFLAVVLVAWSLEANYLPAVYPDWTSERRWGVGMLVSLLFFGSVLAHELAHALVARRRGYPVDSITLLVFGGVSAIGQDARTARDEFWIAVVGPLTSFVIAALFGAAWLAGRMMDAALLYPIAGYLALINVSLGLFNLVPGFPLDGGRVLRALLWARKGNILEATRLATIAGRAVAGAMMLIGLISIIAGGFLSGFWFILIGWFLWGAAESSYQQLLLRTSLEGITVETLVERDVPRVAPDLSIGELVNQHVLRHNRRVFFVAPDGPEDGEIQGLITLTDIKRVPEVEWATTSVYRTMTPRDRLVVAAPLTEALSALELMVQNKVHQLPVFQGRVPLGLLTREGVIQAIRLRSTFGRSG